MWHCVTNTKNDMKCENVNWKCDDMREILSASWSWQEFNECQLIPTHYSDTYNVSRAYDSSGSRSNYFWWITYHSHGLTYNIYASPTTLAHVFCTRVHIYGAQHFVYNTENNMNFTFVPRLLGSLININYDYHIISYRGSLPSPLTVWFRFLLFSFYALSNDT